MKDYVLYGRLEDRETILEVWGGSTKHPDLVYRFSDFQKTDLIGEEFQIFQWILECASRLVSPTAAMRLARFAMENCYL